MTSKDCIDGCAQMGLQCDKFGRQNRDAFRQIDDDQPLAFGTAAALLTGAAHLTP